MEIFDVSKHCRITPGDNIGSDLTSLSGEVLFLSIPPNGGGRGINPRVVRWTGGVPIESSPVNGRRV